MVRESRNTQCRRVLDRDCRLSDGDLRTGVAAQLPPIYRQYSRRAIARRRGRPLRRAHRACELLWLARLYGHDRSEEHTSELQSLMRISYAVFCLKNKKKDIINYTHTHNI